MLAPKSAAYYAGRLNLRDGGAATKRVLDASMREYDKRAHTVWQTMQDALGLHPGDPEQRRVGYNLRLNATIPFGILDEMGMPAMQPSVDPATGQVPVDEQGAPMMQPVIEYRPVWDVLAESFPTEYLRQAKDAVKLGANVPAKVRYDVQEAER